MGRRDRLAVTAVRSTVAFAALAAAWSWASPAAAFCRITTIESRADGEDLTACYDTTHPPVWWLNACVGLSVQSSGSEYASYDVVHDLLFHTVLPNWMNATCPGGGSPSIQLVDLGPVQCDERQANVYGPNTNSILFHDYAWPYEDGAGCMPGQCCDTTIALTTVTFHPGTGELWDADIELNTACHPVSTTLPVPDDRFDLQSILQHETGHFLGLAHPPDSSAIMYYLYTPGNDGKRVLDSDDIDGICSVYPPDGDRSVARSVAHGGVVPAGTCDPTPRNGFAKKCVSASDDQPPPASSSTCQTSSAPAPLLPIHGLLGAAGLAFAVRSRRRVRRGTAC